MALIAPKFELRFGRVNTGNPGVLIISDKYEFLYNKSNNEKDIFYYYCKHKRTKGTNCRAKASLVKLEIDGELKYYLKSWSDDQNHPGCAAPVLQQKV